MDSETRFSPSPDIASSKVEDEHILMSMKNGAFYILDGTAAEIWERVQPGITFGALIDSLVEAYDVDRETCVQDSKALLNDLMSKNLIVQT